MQKKMFGLPNQVARSALEVTIYYKVFVSVLVK